MNATDRRPSVPGRKLSLRAVTRGMMCGLGLITIAIGCSRDEDATRVAPPTNAERLLVTAGHLQAGTPVRAYGANPLAGDASAIGSGRRLFLSFNCAGCHGAHGGGGMGPPLLDADWTYGNDPASIFQSIAQGRPNGMPAFGGKVPDEEIWRLEAFVRSLGGTDTIIRAGGSSGMSPTEAQRRTGG